MKNVQSRLLKLIASKIPSYTQLRYKFFENHVDFIKLIQIDFLEPNDGEFLFTISFGVYVGATESLIWGKSTELKKIVPGFCVFECGVSDIINEFKFNSGVQSWKLQSNKNDDIVFQEVGELMQNKVFPFSERFESLEKLNDIVTELEFPLKYLAARPLMIVALKIIQKRELELKDFVETLEKRKYYAMSTVRKIIPNIQSAQ